ncbi:hypothetical protein TNCV_2322201 [Trichonephila clavipes]|nr:hypothetical protein TNCV_2322201 [Trichonephila clavipes]
MPAEWRSRFVTGLLYPKLRVRPRPKSVDFPDAESRQRPCRMIIRTRRHETTPLRVKEDTEDVSSELGNEG